MWINAIFQNIYAQLKRKLYILKFFYLTIMKKKEDLFKASWAIVKKNKILFAPNLIILSINVLLVIALFFLTGLFRLLIENDPNNIKAIFLSGEFIFFLFLYLVLSTLIDNFFLTMKYGLIKNVLLKKKTNFSNGIKFAKEHYWTTLGIHILSFLIIYVPLILLGIVLFTVLPASGLIAAAIFIPLMIVYLIFIAIRLLFVYPTMTFEKKGAYNSLKEDFHFVKTHLHHTMVTWLVILLIGIVTAMIKRGIEPLQGILFQQVVFLGFLLAIAIIALEMTVSVWEHVYIFKSYLVGKKRKRKNKKN